MHLTHEQRFNLLAGSGLELGCILLGVGCLMEGYAHHLYIWQAGMMGILLMKEGWLLITIGLLTRVPSLVLEYPIIASARERLFTPKSLKRFMIVFSLIYVHMVTLTGRVRPLFVFGPITVLAASLLLMDEIRE